jgi:hypothetical protein
VAERWRELQIEEKITFEEELTKELGDNEKSLFSFFNKQEKKKISTQ